VEKQEMEMKMEMEMETDIPAPIPPIVLDNGTTKLHPGHCREEMAATLCQCVLWTKLWPPTVGGL